MLPRAFVAVDLDLVDRQALQVLQQRLGRAPSGGWVAAEDLHLTLRFLGDIDAHQLASVAEHCAALAATARAATARPEAVAAWSTRQAHVVVLTLVVEPCLASLQQALCALPHVAPADSRPWRPHITLRRGRTVPVERPVESLMTGSIRCDRITLFARADAGAPLRYRRVACWPLQGRGVQPG